MPQMTPGQARIIDPILTEVARGYGGNQSPVADILFPVVDVGQRGGRIVVYGVEEFKLVSTVRAPGANTKRTGYTYGSTSYSLIDYRIEATVPAELQQEAQNVPGIDLAATAVRRVRNAQSLEREKQAADLALNAASYANSNKATLSGTDQWSHSSSNPHKAIADAREAVRARTGRKPNVLTVGPRVATALRYHPLVMGNLPTTSMKTPATLQQLAAQFEVDQVIEAGAIYHDGTSFVDVWSDFAHLAYTVTGTAADLGEPTFGYTYRLMGMPAVEEGYFDKNSNSWYYPVTDARQPVLAGADAGFLFSDVLA